MGLISRTLKVTAFGSVATIGLFFGSTRNDEFVPMAATDPIFQSPFYKKFNPNNNPTTHDLCVRRIPLDKIRPELLEKKGKLATSPQRAFLERKYRAETPDQLWDRKDLLKNEYNVGTLITDHFEVLEKTDDLITIRCGDTPRHRDVRPADGLFQIGAVVKPEQGIAEFTLKSCFFQGEGKADAVPMGPWMDWAHKQYTKLWLESGVLKNVVR
ncbi:hypothetical protein N7468_008516 [Penicillium chermesinum]|uniref:Uncharacterized protein n=1 Tax=Penicillium chermesinum TaxID=63820 RepID=A0A9W9NSQ6_9EURO|nr:uncharacterized protein N7468_008516 [Penicillium chermesinum]KAJ5223974.1 hypothetical protein N7468_008516 [Penicillium chermesinum]